jgi:serine/threonine protein kinase
MAQGSLGSKLSPPLSQTERMIVMHECASGFEYMHARHVMHRDIKPAAIIMDDDHHPRIGDLGMAKMSKDSAMTLAMGTPVFVRLK